MRFDIGKAKASQPREEFVPNPKLKLLGQVSKVMRFKHLGACPAAGRQPEAR
jgi:hypothetical protein